MQNILQVRSIMLSKVGKWKPIKTKAILLSVRSFLKAVHFLSKFYIKIESFSSFKNSQRLPNAPETHISWHILKQGVSFEIFLPKIRTKQILIWFQIIIVYALKLSLKKASLHIMEWMSVSTAISSLKENSKSNMDHNERLKDMAWKVHIKISFWLGQFSPVRID